MQVNESRYGLQAGLFTPDPGRIFEAFEETCSWQCHRRRHAMFRVDHMPYGGVKDSGLGRDGLRYAIEELAEPGASVFQI
jgi:acyl-CoA reductase-like NAD-dependent aldehyde dehydrogenase